MKYRIYHVLCTNSVAAEMARYEGNSVVESVDHELTALDWDTENPVRYHQVLGIPNIGRWASFGVRFVRAQTLIIDRDSDELYADPNDYVDARLAKIWRERSERKIKLFTNPL
jgi:signal transduction protein with GAF and PtsI domain